MNKLITEDELFLVLVKDGRFPKQIETKELYDNFCGCMMACESEPGKFGMTSALSNRRLVIEVDALDNSLINKHIVKGDVLKVRTHVEVGDGDLVLAVVNGKSMIRALFCDVDNSYWLVPMNSDYEPVMMTDDNKAEIVGKVIGINRYNLSVSFKDLSEPVRKAKLKMPKPRTITSEQVSWVIQTIGPSIRIARMWFAVFRAMTQKKVYAWKEFEAFTMRVRAELPNHPKLPVTEELQKMDILSFSKKIDEWIERNAPVSGKRFYKYKDAGERTLALLDADFENSPETLQNSTEKV